MDFLVHVITCMFIGVCLHHVHASCPAECVCLPSTDAQSGTEGYLVTCIDLTELPIPWPEDVKPVTEFHLNELVIDELPDGFFTDMESVRRITIRFSKIGSLGSGSFSRLTGLSPDAVLMLSFNDIGVISSNAFKGLTNFASIQITGGSIGVIQPKAFNGIDTGSFIINGVQIGSIEAKAMSSISFHVDFSLPSALKSLPVDVLQRLPTLNSTGLAGCDDLSIKDSKTSFISLSSNTITSIATDAFFGISGASLIVAYSNTIGLVSRSIFGPSTAVYAVSFTSNAIEAMDDHAFQGLGATEKLVIFGNAVSCLDVEALEGIDAMDTINQNNVFSLVDSSDNRTFCQHIMDEPTTMAPELTTTQDELTTESTIVGGTGPLSVTTWLVVGVTLIAIQLVYP